MAAPATKAPNYSVVNMRMASACSETSQTENIYFLSSNLSAQSKATKSVDSNFTESSAQAILDPITAAWQKALRNNFEAPEIDIRLKVREVVTTLRENGLSDYLISPLSQGGMAINFGKNESSYLLEIYNDNEDVFSITSANGQISAWDVDHNNLIIKLNEVFV